MLNVGVLNLRAKRLLPVVAASVVLLTGCGVQGLQWHPGVAATVGDQTITDQRIDELATGYCTAIKPQIQSGEVAPLGYLRNSIVRGLVIHEAAEQVADHYGVKPGATYERALSTQRSQATGLSASAADAYVELNTLGAYQSAVAQAVGGAVLSAGGDVGASTTDKSAAGQKAIERFLDTEDVEISPAYDVVIENGEPMVGDTDTSYAESSTAKAGYAWLTSDKPSTQYAATLPASQVCG